MAEGRAIFLVIVDKGTKEKITDENKMRLKRDIHSDGEGFKRINSTHHFFQDGHLRHCAGLTQTSLLRQGLCLYWLNQQVAIWKHYKSSNT